VQVYSLSLGLGITLMTIIVGISLKTMLMSQANERKLALMIEVLTAEHPDFKLKIEMLRSHQELASAPAYFLARLVSLMYDRTW
jgi:hypothetical protein